MTWLGKSIEEVREYDRQYRKKNKDRINQQDRDYYNRTNGKDIPSPLTAKIDTKSSGIKGPRPSKGERAIYYLHNNDEHPYYVGSSGTPTQRWNNHRKTGKSGGMVIIKCCPEYETVYWESKLIVDLTELGFILENVVAPCFLKFNK